jgi:hypothetical protein
VRFVGGCPFADSITPDREPGGAALDILTSAFSRPAQMLEVVRNFLTFMQPYWPLAFLTGPASLVPQNGFIRGDSLAIAI